MIGRVAIDGLQVDCIIGCLTSERTTPQRLRLDLWVELPTDPAADSDDLSAALDYTAIARQVTFILQSGRFHLLESAARMLLRHLLLPPAPGERRPGAVAAGVSLTKAGVFPHGARPRLTLSAAADEVTWTQTERPWGTVDAIDASRRLRLERLNIAPGQQAPGAGEARLRIGGEHPDQWRSLLQITRPGSAPDQ